MTGKVSYHGLEHNDCLDELNGIMINIDTMDHSQLEAAFHVATGIHLNAYNNAEVSNLALKIMDDVEYRQLNGCNYAFRAMASLIDRTIIDEFDSFDGYDDDDKAFLEQKVSEIHLYFSSLFDTDDEKVKESIRPVKIAETRFGNIIESPNLKVRLFLMNCDKELVDKFVFASSFFSDPYDYIDAAMVCDQYGFDTISDYFDHLSKVSSKQNLELSRQFGSLHVLFLPSKLTPVDKPKTETKRFSEPDF